MTNLQRKICKPSQSTFSPKTEMSLKTLLNLLAKFTRRSKIMCGTLLARLTISKRLIYRIASRSLRKAMISSTILLIIRLKSRALLDLLA